MTSTPSGSLSSSGKVIIPATPEIPRSGEGTMVLLKNGEVLFIYSRFAGAADHDRGDLYGGILDLPEGGVRDGRIFFEDNSAVNQMNPGLVRLADGDLAITYLRRSGPDEDDVYFSRSSDEGVTWSAPVKVNTECDVSFIVVNCDRLRQFSSGRIAIPAALYPDRKDQSRPSSLAIFYSDDGGETWRLSERVRVEREHIVPPHRTSPNAGKAWEDAVDYFAKEQEPGVEQLVDGRILLYCRTFLGYMYRCWSLDDGECWGPLKAATDLVSPCSPQSIRRIPGSGRLVCIFNDRRSVAFGDEEACWNWRTPLSLAVSDDGGESWRVLGNLEDESHNHCYTSILFLKEEMLLTYYESENSIRDGKPFRRNLASLKMRIVPLAAVKEFSLPGAS